MFQSILLRQNGLARGFIQLDGHKEAHESKTASSALGVFIGQHQAQQIEGRLRGLKLHLLPTADELEGPHAALTSGRNRDRDSSHRLLGSAATGSSNSRDSYCGVGSSLSADGFCHCLSNRFTDRTVFGD